MYIWMLFPPAPNSNYQSRYGAVGGLYIWLTGGPSSPDITTLFWRHCLYVAVIWHHRIYRRVCIKHDLERLYRYSWFYKSKPHIVKLLHVSCNVCVTAKTTDDHHVSVAWVFVPTLFLNITASNTESFPGNLSDGVCCVPSITAYNNDIIPAKYSQNCERRPPISPYNADSGD